MAQAPLAVSLGDPAGVGPELICEAWVRREEERLPPFFVCGGAGLLRQAAASRQISVPVEPVASAVEARTAFARALPVLGEPDGMYRPGQPDAEGARLAYGSLQSAAALTLGGDAGGIVTGPISKALLAEVGFAFPGQTEFVADACGIEAGDAVMMLAGPSLKTVPLTVHVALAEVPRLLTTEVIVRRGRIVAQALRNDFGMAAPRLAVCALNPHAGESGRMGREEIDIIAPAIVALRTEGIDATGPHPADTLFAPRKRATYDVAIAMYHDQALVPLKALDFDHGVNVTLGLPIVRTSPDHGTAFDIAGKGIADPGAMIAAIRMAGEIAAQRAGA
uniref:4-hydroxythreonine-4-phosphate dehydrogenase PdxA n=1 Tax=Altererythrobacter segetis TaxID=1104773 RepID=UPI0014072211|nr:4-hydroxythreonine-4-phosphate dehydrogenase PdxA [Altererythrobacter segetis]